MIRDKQKLQTLDERLAEIEARLRAELEAEEVGVGAGSR
jgi:BMFP domain-containing protein YqiC